MQTPDIEVPGWLTDASKENLIVTSRQLAEYHFLEPMKAGDRVILRSARTPSPAWCSLFTTDSRGWTWGMGLRGRVR